ncbi:MAG: Galactokinase [Verrucomicrobiales bacterium]|nr:Galactokinase [Verrucomicrobiales bacterium]
MIKLRIMARLNSLIAPTGNGRSQADAWVVSAPGRVNLIGEHVDYNGGLVLPAAIDRRVVLTAWPLGRGRLRLRSRHAEREVEIDLLQPLQKGEPSWANYIKGVAAGFQRLGITVPGLDVEIDSTVPAGAGLSSSAALEVAVATLLEEVTGCRLDPTEKALLCQRAEHEFAGVPCGIMDQFASVHGREGHALLLDCRDQTFEHIPMSDPAVSLVIFDTKVKHRLAGSAYARRRASCEAAAAALGVETLREATLEQLEAANLDEETHRRARHVITEIARTADAAAALKSGAWAAAGDLMRASHRSLRDDFEVSCPELDFAADTAAVLEGVYGCRMTGGGFGGCVVGLVATEAVGEISDRLSVAYQKHTGIEPAVFLTRPSGGPLVESVPSGHVS